MFRFVLAITDRRSSLSFRVLSRRSDRQGGMRIVVSRRNSLAVAPVLVAIDRIDQAPTSEVLLNIKKQQEKNFVKWVNRSGVVLSERERR